MSTETLYRAAVVLPVTSHPIHDGFVTIRDGRVSGVGPIADRPTGANLIERDLGKTILMPGFVNAHTHLELSQLQGAVPGDRGFVGWIEDQLRTRAELPADGIAPAIEKDISSMEEGGTVAVADVSNSLAAVEPLAHSHLHAVVLHEVLGFDPSKAAEVLERTRVKRAGARRILNAALPAAASGDFPPAPPRVRVEVAAHAPHSISRELFDLLLKDEGIRSIHVAESRSEGEFLRGGGGEWRSFLDRRVGPIPFTPPGTSPVRYLEALGVLTPGLLAVHCVRADEDDAKLLAARGAVAVLCPRSNEFLGNGLPPLALLLGGGVKVALGTDSLASCPSLDVLDDARLLAGKFPRVPKAALLHALTRGGALALGFDDLGQIRPGALARLATIAFEGDALNDPVAFVLGETAPAHRLA